MLFNAEVSVGVSKILLPSPVKVDSLLLPPLVNGENGLRKADEIALLVEKGNA